MTKRNNGALAILIAIGMASCGQPAATEATDGRLQDSMLNQQKNNSGTPLDDLHRNNSSDTLKEDRDKNTGVPLNNLTREQVEDSLTNTQTMAPE